MKSDDSLIRFPVEFPIKVMGPNSAAFTQAVTAIVGRHLKAGEFSQTVRPSSGGKYLSITVTFTAQSKEQLDALYEELNRNELVKMTL